jgi:glycosyltransferase involved in cell wall biosynthesis
MIRVIQSVGSLTPETGGPARSVRDLSLALAESGVEVILLTLDFGSIFSPPLIPEHDLIKLVTVPVQFRAGLRALFIPGFTKKLREICNDREDLLIHDHGIWLPQNLKISSFAASNGIPLIISPRGMLEPEALNIGFWRKKLFWKLFQGANLTRADALHATSQGEKENLLILGLTEPIRVISNGTHLPLMIERKPASPGKPLKLLFLSRIHPIKGLIHLIGALSKLDLSAWELEIAGYDEVHYLSEVLRSAQRAGINENIRYLGPVEDQAKWELYHQADLFILPSLSENFGIVVAEALAAGLPVITTTGTPWEDLNKYNCGWWVEPSELGLCSAIEQALELPQDQLIEMGKRGRRLVEEKYSWKVIGDKTINSYEEVLSRKRSSDHKTGIE